MVEAINPFTGIKNAAHGAIETLFRDLYSTGEFEEIHYQLLGQWREARGEDAKTDWRWWVGYGSDPVEYSNEHDTRQAALNDGRLNYVEDGCFSVIEARQWADDVLGENNDRFAESRNKATIKAGANDDHAEKADG